MPDSPDLRARLLAMLDEAAVCDDAARGHALACEATALARSSEADEGLLGRACLLQADFSYGLFDYVGSYERALEATDLLARAADRTRRAAAANLCLVTCIETGDVTRALEYAQRELALARREGDTARLAQLLHNQAALFDIMEEYDAAVPCLVESAQLNASLCDGADDAFFARVNLAAVHLSRADQLRARDDADGVEDARRAAAHALPDFDACANLAALQTWICVKARLCDIAGARRGALDYLRRVRRAGLGERYRTYALLAMAECHVQAGRRDKAVHRFELAIAKLRRAQNQSHLGSTECRLAAVYAEAGDYESALAWMRQAHADRARLQDERHRLRCRLAVIEREAEPARRQHREAAAHAQRLGVIGRMMAEIHHALAGPLDQTRQLIVPWVGDDRMHEQAPVLVPAEAIRQIIASIDEAAALARQLKMFSYRAAPQLMDIEFEAAVHEAWRGLALWRRADPLPLSVTACGRVVVRADVQRLGVLLRILLIEIDKTEFVGPVRIRFDTHESEVCMHVEWAPGTAASDNSIGVALCEEIAQEMGGRLAQAIQRRPPVKRFMLCLPAVAQVE